jgi:hypothetical protein
LLDRCAARKKIETDSLPGSYVEPLKFTTRRVRRGTLVNADEPMRRRCLARIKLEDFFNILLESLGEVSDLDGQDMSA